MKDDFRTQLTAVIDDLLSWAMHLIGAEHISQDCGAVVPSPLVQLGSLLKKSSNRSRRRSSAP